MLLFAAMLVSTQIDQFISGQIENAIRNPDGLSSSVYFFGSLSLLVNLIFPVVLILIALFGFQEKPLSSFLSYLKLHLSQLLIETLRSWGRILQWTLLLIIPGVVKYIQLMLVPFITTLSPQYAAGQVDALSESTKLVNSRFAKFFGFMVLFQIFIPLILTSIFDEYRILWQSPLPCLLLTLLDTYLFLLATQCLLFLFKKTAQEAR